MSSTSTSLHGTAYRDRPPAPASPRSLFLPKEHGAYALILAPLLTAFCRGAPSWVGAGFAIATVAAFLAHEPALVLLAQRGARARRELGGAARRAFLVRATVAAAAGLAALARGDLPTRVSVAALAGLVALVGLFALRRHEKSDLGTLLLAVTAAAAGVPVALGNGWDVETALLTNAVFGVTGGVAMLTVRELIPKRRREAGLAAYLGFLVALVVGVVFVTQALDGAIAPYFAWALTPIALAACGLLVARPAPTHLRAVGWSLAAAQVATFLVLAFA